MLTSLGGIVQGFASIIVGIDDGPIHVETISTNVLPSNATGRAKWVALFVLFAVLVILILSFGYTFDWTWTGFVEIGGGNEQVQSAKTLWDWLDLLGVPVILALGAWYLNKAETRRRSAEQAKTASLEQAAAARREYRDVVNAYVAAMTELLMKHGLRASEPEAEVRTIARTRTLLALSSVDGTHKGEIIEFLANAGLIRAGDSVVNLHGADLSFAELVAADLKDTSLSGSDLSGARLDASDLRNADLREAKLGARYQSPNLAVGTSMVGANLEGADLSGAEIGSYVFVDLDTTENIRGFGTDLSEASLAGANLSSVDLLQFGVTVTGTSNLRGGGEFHAPSFKNCDLRSALISVNIDQLRASESFSGAIL